MRHFVKHEGDKKIRTFLRTLRKGLSFLFDVSDYLAIIIKNDAGEILSAIYLTIRLRAPNFYGVIRPS